MATPSQYELFQAALSAARLAKSLTQADVASKLDKPQSYVSKYENGERRLDVIEFLQVCAALSVSPQSILRQVERPHD